MFVSGASASVVRATIMMIPTIISKLIYRKSDIYSNISLALLIQLIVSPLIIYDVGFVLSYGGTIGIVFFSKKLNQKLSCLGKFADILSVTLSAQLALVPIMAYYFNTISILSILSNLIVVPISGLITVLGFFTFIISKIFMPFATILSKPLYMISKIVIFISDVFSNFPLTVIKVVTPNLFEIVIVYILFYILFISKTSRKKVWCLVLCFLLVTENFIYILPKPYVTFNAIDVGQGDSFYIKTPRGKIVLVDGGGSESYDVGENIVIPYLLDRRNLIIDTVFISHSDSDHLNGIISILRNLKVKNIVIAKKSLGFDEVYKIAKEKNIKIIEVMKGDNLIIDGVHFKILSPSNLDSIKDINEYSLVMKMIYGEMQVLFTGDISSKTESKLYDLDADILKVSHHGSNFSTSKLFLDKVSPIYAVISVGKQNSYGHPGINTLSLLNKVSKVYQTAHMGEICFKIYKSKIVVE